MIETTVGVDIAGKMFSNYFKYLVNSFFKILPMWENKEATLKTYMNSLQIELLGSEELISELKYDSNFITLTSILQYLIDNPDCPVKNVKREVFRAINICNKMKDRYDEVV